MGRHRMKKGGPYGKLNEEAVPSSWKKARKKKGKKGERSIYVNSSPTIALGGRGGKKRL